MQGDIIVETEVAEVERLAKQGLAKTNAVLEKLEELRQAAAKRSFSDSSENSTVTATVNGAGKLLKLSIAPLDRRYARADRLSTDLLVAIQSARTVAAHEVNKRIAKVVSGIDEEAGAEQ